MATAVVCAYSLVGRRAIEALVRGGVEILALYTYNQPDADKWFEAPAEYARRQGIPVFCEADFNAGPAYTRILGLGPDFLFSFYFREMVGEKILRIPKSGAYNLHGSLLPKYRGRAPVNWVLARGETKTGITLHAMTAKPDDGDIFGQVEIPIAWDETALSLTGKMAEAGYGLVLATVSGLVNGTLQGIPQTTLGKSSYFGGRGPEDGRLGFWMTAHEAFNLIRAVADPWPNAFLAMEERTVKISWALPDEGRCPQGLFRHTDEGILLGFADAPLKLVTLKRGQERSDDPRIQSQWLKGLGIEECAGH